MGIVKKCMTRRNGCLFSVMGIGLAVLKYADAD
jgi:hypothetical protein